MESGNYNRTSGRKTLVLVTTLIVLIIILSLYSVFLLFKKSAVVTKSTYYERPVPIIQPTSSTNQTQPSSSLTIPTSIERHGD